MLPKPPSSWGKKSLETTRPPCAAASSPAGRRRAYWAPVGERAGLPWPAGPRAKGRLEGAGTERPRHDGARHAREIRRRPDCPPSRGRTRPGARRRRAQGPPYSPAPHPPRGGPSTAVAAGDSAGRPAKRGRTELAGADRTAGVGSDAKTKTCDKIRCLGPLPIGRTALAPRLRALPGLPHAEGSRPARPAGRGPPSSPCGARRSVCVCVCVCVCVVSARPPDRQEFSHPIPEAHRPPKP